MTPAKTFLVYASVTDIDTARGAAQTAMTRAPVFVSPGLVHFACLHMGEQQAHGNAPFAHLGLTLANTGVVWTPNLL